MPHYRRDNSASEKRSTIDALGLLKSTVEEAVSMNRYAVAVSLDIKNAFNSLQWGVIREALVRKRYPSHLKGVLGGYLSERAIEFLTEKGYVTMEVGAGVPQGSVLGPILWSIGFNLILERWGREGEYYNLLCG